MVFFRIFAGKIKNMTQKEAIIKALEKLGGRAQLKEIYPLAMVLGDFTGSEKPENTIRNYLYTNPDCFIKSPNKPKGWWELISFQEEIADMKKRIEALEEENARLKAVPTEDDFVNKLVTDAKNRYKYEKDMIKAIRAILYNLGRTEDAAKLDAWIEGKEYKPSMNVEGDVHVHGNFNDVHDNKTVSL